MLRPGQGGGGGFGDLRFEGAQLFEHRVGAEEEVARIPQIALGDIALGGLQVGLLDEGGDAARDADAERRARTDVAIADRRLGRRDAEGDDRPFRRRRFAGDAADGEEALLVEHDVVGGEHRDDGLRIALGADLGGDRHRRAGVAPRRLDDDRRLGADLVELLARQKAIVVIGDDDWLVEDRIVDPLDRLLEGRSGAEQRDELLRHGLARFWPDARACAAAHDDRQNLLRHACLALWLATGRRR